MKKIYIMPQSLVVEIEDVIIATSTPGLKDSPSNTEDWNLSKDRGALDEMLDEQDF